MTTDRADTDTARPLTWMGGMRPLLVVVALAVSCALIAGSAFAAAPRWTTAAVAVLGGLLLGAIVYLRRQLFNQ